jgi:hypothetical protein
VVQLGLLPERKDMYEDVLGTEQGAGACGEMTGWAISYVPTGLGTGQTTGEQGAGASGEMTGWAISYVPTGWSGHVARKDDSRFIACG